MEYIEFGKIVNTHALKGEIKVYSYTDNVDRILKLKKVYIDTNEYLVEKVRFLKNMFTFKLKEVDSIEQAELLVGKMISRSIEKSERENTDEFFIKDLIGMKVIDEQGATLGELKEVFATGANDVYRVVLIDGSEKYLPAISQVILNIDLSSKCITVRMMEGL